MGPASGRREPRIRQGRIDQNRNSRHPWDGIGTPRGDLGTWRPARVIVRPHKPSGVVTIKLVPKSDKYDTVVWIDPFTWIELPELPKKGIRLNGPSRTTNWKTARLFHRCPAQRTRHRVMPRRLLPEIVRQNFVQLFVYIVFGRDPFRNQPNQRRSDHAPCQRQIVSNVAL